MELLLVGLSRFAQRRVLPAAAALDEITRIHVASARGDVRTIAGLSKLGQGFRNWREAVRSMHPCLVYVSLVNGGHAAAVTGALDQRHHVIVDKPALLDLATAERTVAVARTSSLVIAEATCYSYHPLFAALQTIFRTNCSQATKAVAIFTPPVRSGDFRYDGDLGGGALFDTGPYLASLGRVLWDEEPVSIAALVADRAANSVETAYSVLAGYSAGKTIVGHFGFTTTYRNSLMLLGPDCVAEIERPFSALPDTELGIRVQSGGQTYIQEVESADSMRIFLARVVAAAMNGSREFDDPLLSDARTLSRLVQAART